MNVQLAISSKDNIIFCSGAVAYSDAYFGSGSGPHHLDDVRCTGSEVSVLSCSHSGIGVHNCRPGNEAGVNCTGKLVGLIPGITVLIFCRIILLSYIGHSTVYLCGIILENVMSLLPYCHECHRQNDSMVTEE